MRTLVWSLLLCSLAGCRSLHPPAPVVYENPIRVQAPNADFLWDRVVDIVDDYFEIEHEQRPKVLGTVVTAGRIDTFPQGGSTLLEPWRGDSVGEYERLESTLQSMRRRAIVIVVPSEEGYLVDVAVFKELEDVSRPDQSPTAAANFRVDDSLSRLYADPIPDISAPTNGWISQGRDPLLEQKIICKIITTLNH
jgi:hypothetical protein